MQADRQDKSAVGWDHVEKLQKHESQIGKAGLFKVFIYKLYNTTLWSTDYAVGFGGKFGVQSDRQDKSAVGWDNVETVEKHQSQIDHSKVSFIFNQNFTLNLFLLIIRVLVESLEYKMIE